MAPCDVQGVKVAIPKSAAASLEALANFALDGCEEPFGAGGDAYDTASTAVKNPFGGGDVLVRACPLWHHWHQDQPYRHCKVPPFTAVNAHREGSLKCIDAQYINIPVH